ncbi:mercuric transporter MerT family protein [Methylocystis sp. ATCC 49242]|uniref:mercuric transporter MerT family protein n=1 Tax=Methylocystis sp. ATCC 49242 TaxID=622637 RepID=UPI0001F86B04|nr:mercuric transporter MerT family protein [Methylocystis sp. ATCC 49242]
MTVNDATPETTPIGASHPAKTAAPKCFAALGLVTGLGAVVASSCCVIPLGLAALGAGAGVLGRLATIAEWRVPFLAVSALAIVGGWGAWWRTPPAPCVSGSACASPQRSRATLGLLLCASLIAMLAASWSYIDPMLLKFLKGR